MFATRHFFVFALLLILAFSLALLVFSAGRFSYEQVTPIHPQTVEVSPGLSPSVSDAVLHLSIYEPVDASPTNYRSAHFGGRSLQHPVGSGGELADMGGTWDENRLIAINADGFKILFTKQWRLPGVGQEIHQETNVILFRYGQVTDTNVIGWRIIGKFE
jgi:hypothetical protein